MLEPMDTVPAPDGNDDVELVRLRDGCLVTVRPATADDEPALRSFLRSLSLSARRRRFFTAAGDVEAAAHLMARPGGDRFGLVAHDEDAFLVGHARYVQLGEKSAEVAVEVADHIQGRGLGTILVERLAAVAERRGITRFVAEVLPDNHPMLDVFRCGFDASVTFHDGTEKVEFPTSSWQLAHERFPDRRPRLKDAAGRAGSGL